MPLKGILIVGIDEKGNHSIDNDFEVYKNNPDYLIIDASHELMTEEGFRAKLSSYEITRDTRIDIWAHGLRKNEREDGSADHEISLLSDVPLTKDVLSIISEVSGNKPIQAHLWSCYGGTAARAVENLPEGSIVMGHGPEKSVTSVSANKKAINDSISAAIINDTNRMSSVGQDLVNNMPSYIMQDLNIGLKGVNSEVERFHFDEASPNISEIESIRGLFTGYSKQIISAIGSMKERGLLPPEIELPVMKTYSEEEIKSYEFDRTLFDLFLRNDIIRRQANPIDFSKIIRDGVLISQEEAKSLDLNEGEKRLLDPEFQKVLLNARNIKGESYLLKLSEYSGDWKNRDGSIDYIIEIAKKNNVLEKYLSQKNPLGMTSLTMAIYKKNELLAKKLINTGLGLDITHQSTYSPLLVSIYTGQDDLAKLLIEKGADVNARNNDGENLLVQTIKSNVNTKFIEFLIENGADVNAKDRDGNSILFLAVEKNLDISLIERISELTKDYRSMIENGVDLNQKNPLLLAIQRGNDKVAQLLIRNGTANLNEGNPLLLAIRSGKTDIARLLIENGADVNARDKNGNLLMALNISKDNRELFEKLKQGGLDINSRNSNGENLLVQTIKSNVNTKFIEFLIENGADVNAKDRDGNSILSLAVEKNLDRSLIQKISDRIEDRTLSKSNLLRKSIIDDNLDAIKNCINEGAQVHEPFLLKPIPQPFEYLRHTNNPEIAIFLLEKIKSRRGSELNSLKVIETVVACNNLEVAKLLYEKLNDRDKKNFNSNEIVSAKNKEVARYLFSQLIREQRNEISFKKIGSFVNEEVLRTLADDGVVIDKAAVSIAVKNWEYAECKVLVDSGYAEMNDLMIESFKQGRAEFVDNLLEEGFNPNIKNQEGVSVFNLALESGNVDLVKKMIGKGADVNARDSKGVAPLEMAIISGQTELANFLLDSGADFNSKNESGISSFNLALESGNVDLVKKMIGKGADVNAMDSKGESPLSIVIENGNAEIAKTLIEAGANINAQDNYGRSILFKVILNKNAEIAKTLIEAGADVNVRDMVGGSILGSSNFCNDKIAKLLLEKGADVNAAPGTNYPPLTNVLRYGASEENKKRVKLLIEYGAYISKKKAGLAPIDNAREVGLEDFVVQEKKNYRMRRAIKENRSVLKEGLLGRFEGDPNGVDSKGKSMLSYAIEAGNLDAVKKLIKMGANVNLVSEASDMSILHEAAKSGNKEIYNKLIEAGANRELLDRDGRKPSEYLHEVRSVNAMKFSFNVSKGVSDTSPKSQGVLERKKASIAGIIR